MEETGACNQIGSELDENVVDNLMDEAVNDGDLCGNDEDGEVREDDDDLVEDFDEDFCDHIGDDVNSNHYDENEHTEGMITPIKNRSQMVVAPPSVGMVFPSWEDVNKYYRSYGKQEGFGVVCAGGGRSLKKEEGNSKSLRAYVWKCESFGRTAYRRMVNGKRITVAEEPMVKKKSKKCDCPVMMYATRNKDGEWVIKKSINEHKNHNPTPRKSQHIAMFRRENITKTIEFRIDNDYESGAPIGQIYNNLSSQRNGVENIGFSKKDMRNMVIKKMRLKLRDGDATAMLDYFDKMTRDNQNFFHMHRLDESGKLKDVMWVDARSRSAYQYFGDVVCFDSTYLTNQYELPFSNFVGVNHHGQTILLGCALVSHEDAETFVWLFKTWLSCMGGKPPAAIMTDQDAAMRKALCIAMPMPQTRHRWCMWHIMQKFAKKLSSLTKYQEIKEMLQNVIYNSLTPEEFVESWSVAINKYELLEKPCYSWLEGLYEQREMWIPAYVKHIFWAGMQTTQRVESINSFFDGYLKKNTRLYQFAPRYCKAMESRAKDEQEADANCARYVRPLMTEFALERKFQKLYTDAKFLEVQIQCIRVLYLTAIAIKDVSDQVEEHIFSDRVWIWSKFLKREIALSNRRHNYTVTFNKETTVATCDCKHFECHGIVCRHIIKVLDMHNVIDVPQIYILDRWRKDIQRKHTRVKVVYHDPSKTEDVKRYDKVMVAFEPVVLRASVSDDYIDILLDLIKLMVIQLDEKEAMTEGGENACGPSSVGNRKDIDKDENHNVPTTTYSFNKDGSTSGASPSSSLISSSLQVVKDPIPRGKKAHRTRDTRFISPIEKLKTLGKQGKRNKGATDKKKNTNRKECA